MSKSIGQYGVKHPLLGNFSEKLSKPIINIIGNSLKFYNFHSSYTKKKRLEIKNLLSKGESVYLIGIGPAGHNSAAALVEVSSKNGIRAICNNEEERYTGINDDGSFPTHSLNEIFNYLKKNNIAYTKIFAIVTSWDYLAGISTCIRIAFEEAPASFSLINKSSSPQMNIWHFIEALKAPKLIKTFFNSVNRMPIIGMRHHNNHAYFPYAVSPFAKKSKPTMIVVMDGFGDDGSISLYIAKNKQIELIRRCPDIFDSQGLLYAIISSTQGGWATLSSEGRYMGASAWGDTSRLTNPFYKRLREILHFGSDGHVYVNKRFINYNRNGQQKPYKKALIDILGEPIPVKEIWNPDCILNIDDIKHAQITQERVDKAAALQLIFEDALTHIVDYLISFSGSNQLILSGGTALNCVANMNLLKHFNEKYYFLRHKKENLRLHLWVPPNPSDTGTAIGAAFQFAIRCGAPFGKPMRHAFICGSIPTSYSIETAIAKAKDTKCIELGNIQNQNELKKIANLVAIIIANNGIIGLFQGRGETGPRALGHRSILANPCNVETRTILNNLVKYRELIRPLAPMMTLKEAKRLYHLSSGASDDEYNAYYYMVLTVKAKFESQKLIPSVIHKDGTSRIQIVRKETDPFSYEILKAIGKQLGVELVVNTSLNVGTPIVQTPEQAIKALHRSRGLTCILMVGDNGKTYLVWHNIKDSPKDEGIQLMKWIKSWENNYK
ncbi:MAG: hypothetical protein KAT33_04890 [Bacteroidales bacterium]|jgi:carbamoyltransferase|nr:hypothetical protein [Bacteroidales bacterium]MCK4638734.1 hypothetical protein [Bacteroidales bacterium]